jgi:hypothetical protein
MSESVASTTTRQSLLRRGMLLAGVAAGYGATRLGFPASGSAKAAPGKTPTATSFTLHARSLTIQGQARRGGTPLARGERTSVFGELIDRAAGTKVGEFYSAQFATLAPFGANPYAAGALEMHTFNLAGGTILGMGSHFDGNGTYAIVGGTGRFHAARGSYVASQRPLGIGGDGTATFTFHLTP